MGSPIAPDEKQYPALQDAAKLATVTGSPMTTSFANGVARLQFRLPRQGVSLLVFQW